MEVDNRWYNNIIEEIGLHKERLSRRESKKYKLDLLLRVTRRVADFSSLCGECQMFKQEITGLTQDLALLVQIPRSQQNKEQRRNYFRIINNIIKHLQKQHKLVTEGQYIGISLAIGVGVGTVLGLVFGNPGVGPGIGTAIGIAIGSYLDKKAKREGRTI